MTREEVFNIWAPRGAIWSPWVKPVIFAHMSQGWIDAQAAAATLSFQPYLDLTWAPRAFEGTSFVVDLWGLGGVVIGMALAELGYRPVPLYNGAPGPEALATTDPAAVLQASMVEVEPIMKAILAATGRLSALGLPPDAPPAFLLDWGRRWSIDPPAPGRFDNRSVSFVTDFPSANLLLSQSIQRAVVIQSVGDQPQADLAHTLRRWQAGGIEIRLKRLEEPGPPAACVVGKPSRFDILVGRFLALLGLRRNPLGGFGGSLPAPSSG